MVLADAVHLEPKLVGQLGFLDHLAQPLRPATARAR